MGVLEGVFVGVGIGVLVVVGVTDGVGGIPDWGAHKLITIPFASVLTMEKFTEVYGTGIEI